MWGGSADADPPSSGGLQIRALATTAGATATAATPVTLLGLVDAQSAATRLGAIHSLDSRLRVGIVLHLHERKAAGTTGLPVHGNVNVRHGTSICLEERAKLLLGH